MAVPASLEEVLSPAWLTAALGARYPGIEVVAVDPGPVVSRISTNARFRIECAGPLPDGLPADLCVKGYFSEYGQSPIHVGALETTFYRDLAERTGVHTLRSHHAEVDESTGGCVVISEDVVAQGATFLDSLSPFSPDDAARSLEELATLHAATWMAPDVATADWLTPWFPLLGAVRGIPEISANFEGPIGAGVPERARDAPRLRAAFTAVADESAGAEPWCVVHADPHVANWFRATDGRPGIVDWQLVQRGPWYVDVGYHLASALTVEDRRAHEQDLVHHYLDVLGTGGVPVPPDDQVWAGLRRGMVHGFYLWGITQLVDPPITTAMLERIGTAVADHDAVAAVLG
jgi:hypothetical protein